MTVTKSKGKWFLFVFATTALSMGVLFVGILGIDLYFHKKYESWAGLNIHGYRGPVVGQKRPGERRIVVLGGSTAFGYGVLVNQTFSAFLERKLSERMRQPGTGRFSVVNLAYNNEGAYSFLYTLQDYRSLDYDVVILYEGYNDLGGYNRSVFRHDSPIFRLTGYMPIFPLIFKEKAMVIKSGGNLEAAYLGRKTVFKPNLGARITAVVLEQGVAISQSLEHQLGRLTLKEGKESFASAATSQEPWADYCQWISRAVQESLDRGARVIVVTQPYLTDRHISQQQALAAMLTQQFGNNPRVQYVNLGWGVVDLKNFSLTYDGMHLTASGNELIADHLVEPVLNIFQGEADGKIS